MKIGGGTVGIFGKQESVAATVDVGNVHAAVGTDEAVAGFGDEHPALTADDSFALSESDFGDAGVEIVTAGPGAGGCRGMDGLERNQSAFSFGYDFVLHNQNVAVHEFQFPLHQSLAEFFGDRIARRNFVRKGNGNDT